MIKFGLSSKKKSFFENQYLLFFLLWAVDLEEIFRLVSDPGSCLVSYLHFSPRLSTHLWSGPCMRSSHDLGTCSFVWLMLGDLACGAFPRSHSNTKQLWATTQDEYNNINTLYWNTCPRSLQWLLTGGGVWQIIKWNAIQSGSSLLAI